MGRKIKVTQLELSAPKLRRLRATSSSSEAAGLERLSIVIQKTRQLRMQYTAIRLAKR